ncbi:replication factor A protein [Trifolium pratense]|uniref:Replication factor A protein n=1 Tax=Trifolium pratense TaxID=57577 RepID=A0A2K3NV58_TRIPR|nr:replication factor A protein [Trifolium pratense]
MAKVCKTFDSVVDLVPGKDSIRIKVRVLRLWKVSAFLNPSETSSIEMVLVDEKGGKIHASIKKQFLYMFQSKIEEGEVYKMSYFSVDPQIDSDIGEYALSLISLAEVRSHVIDYEFLVDVIGLLTGIYAEREYVRDGKITKMVVLELTDSTGKCECALFGDYADDITKKLGKGPGGIPVVVIQFAKVKIFRDIVILPSYHVLILVDPDIPEVEVFMNSIALHGIDMDTTIPMIGGRAKPTMETPLRNLCRLFALQRRIVLKLLKKLKSKTLFLINGSLNPRMLLTIGSARTMFRMVILEI